MDILYILLTIVYIFASLFLGFVVLIQKGEGGGLGGAFGGGAVDTAFGAKADMTWKRATAASATLFMVLAIVLGAMQSHMQKGSMAARTAKELEKESAEKKGSLKADDKTGKLEAGGKTE